MIKKNKNPLLQPTTAKGFSDAADLGGDAA